MMTALETIMAEMTLGTAAGTVTAGTDMPPCGIAAGTTVLTLMGAMPVEFVSPGDRIITRSGARTVTAVEIAVVNNARMIRISEGVLGKDRPEADTIVTPSQPILIRDWRAKALAGIDQAVMEAERLVDGEYIRVETVAEARIVTLRFADAQIVYAAGLELGCEAAL
ncbi:MAG: Hint domain-containing protein [Paracoccaceae bacterium]